MLDAKMVNDWCINYGLDSRTPHEAAEWWATTVGMAPSGAVAALGLCLEEIATATRERDEARAEVERLRSVLLGHVPHVYEGNCPDRVDPTQRDSYCPACRILAATEPKP